MKKLVVSNRVFWAGVVLASAALIGRNGGQAQPPTPTANDVTEIRNLKVHSLLIVNENDKPAILMGGSKIGPILQLGLENAPSKVVVLASSKQGPSIVFHKDGKPTRFLSSDGKSDQSGPPASK